MNDSRFSHRCLKTAKEVLQNPTAPLREGMVQAHLREFVRKHPALTLREDRAGNVVIAYLPDRLSSRAGTSRNARRNAPLVMVAHMDHPGFWVEKVTGNIAKLIFKGGVSKPHARVGTRLKFFSAKGGSAEGSPAGQAGEYPPEADLPQAQGSKKKTASEKTAGVSPPAPDGYWQPDTARVVLHRQPP